MTDRNRSADLAVQEWLAEHALLGDLLDQSHQHENTDVWSDTVMPLLRELRWRMDYMFARKSEDGYLGDAVEAAPQFARQCQELEREQGTFVAEVDEMIQWLERGDMSRPGAFRKRLRNFIRRYLNHEHHEASIVQSALETDIGVGD